ncbi:MAG: serine/threonine protein kinase [Planctomycetes bacterium]|nr:serine/threonine protein kinase [Planctomycetota bacterium]
MFRRDLPAHHDPAFTATAPLDPAATLPVAEIRKQPDDASIGRGYDLREELGRGGVGAVFASRQRALDRVVAVKTMLRDGSSESSVAKFRAEAVVTAYLEHPNIVPVHDLAIGPNGALLLVMKKVDGVSWRTLMHPRTVEERERAHSFGLEQHLEILAKVCDAIAFAHARRIVHLDIKPDNVLVGGYGEVLVTDWGCAAAFGDCACSGLVPRTRELTVHRGTPAYMAPEIARGETASASPRTDVFLLGGVLYELLTGRPPHAGVVLGEVLARAAKGDIDLPQVAARDRQMPDELAAIAMSALNPDPQRRPESATAFSELLREFRQHAEAVKLAEAAKTQLATARMSPDASDEHFRRAIAFCERAIDMWPEYAAGRHQLAEARLDYATYALSTRSYRLAHTQAFAAAAHARQSDRWDLFRKAEEVVDQAQRATQLEVARQHHLRRLRVVIGLAVALIIAGLVIGFAVVRNDHRKLAAALAIARSAESQAESARYQAEASVRELKGWAPEWLARAQRAFADRRYSEAALDADAALQLDPHQAVAWKIAAAAYALTDEIGNAQSSLERFALARPDDQSLVPLREIIGRLADHPRTDEDVARMRDVVLSP